MSLAGLYDVLQITVAWSDVHLHGFRIHGKEYDSTRLGGPSSPLHLLLFGNDKVLFWSDPQYLLESATSADGMWTSVGSPSPFTISTSEPQRFYRLRR